MKQTSRKKVLVSSVAMMMVATVSLGSATYAWFSQNTKATASGITAQTTQSSNIVLSENGTDWTDKLVFANYAKNAMNPVSPEVVSGNNFSKFVTTIADTKDAGVKGAAADYTDAVKNVDYTATKLYMKYETSDTAATQNVKVTLNVTDNSDAATSTDKFLRVALVPIDETTKTIQATDIIWGDAQDDFIKDKAAFTALDANNTGKSLTTTTSKELISNATLKANTEYKFDVYVWYEGTDPQCIDANAVNDFSVSFDVAKA